MKIKELRTKKGISQAELGRFVGVERSTICQYEKGTRMPDNNTLIKLADYFGVSVDYLLERGYKITIPVEKWHKSLQQDYAKASKEEKICMEYKYGGVVFDCDKLGIAPAFTEEERALGLSDNHPIALSDDDRELINLFAEAEEKLGKNYVKAIKQMVRLQIDSKDKS